MVTVVRGVYSSLPITNGVYVSCWFNQLITAGYLGSRYAYYACYWLFAPSATPLRPGRFLLASLPQPLPQSLNQAHQEPGSHFYIWKPLVEVNQAILAWSWSFCLYFCRVCVSLAEFSFRFQPSCPPDIQGIPWYPQLCSYKKTGTKQGRNSQHTVPQFFFYWTYNSCCVLALDPALYLNADSNTVLFKQFFKSGSPKPKNFVSKALDWYGTTNHNFHLN